MKTVIIEYAAIAPNVLDLIIRNQVKEAMCSWVDVDEDYFEFYVSCPPSRMAKVEEILASYV